MKPFTISLALALSGLCGVAAAETEGSCNTDGSVTVPNPVGGSSGELTRRDTSRGQGDGTFGSHRDPARTHNGVDIKAAEGASVTSPGSGTVVHSGETRGGGNAVIIKHDGPYTSHFYHLAEGGRPSVGKKVEAGSAVGRVGRSGNVPPKADSHLHFEIRRNGVPVEPVLAPR